MSTCVHHMIFDHCCRETIARVTGGMKVKADRDEVSLLSHDVCIIAVFIGISICCYVGCSRCCSALQRKGCDSVAY